MTTWSKLNTHELITILRERKALNMTQESKKDPKLHKKNQNAEESEGCRLLKRKIVLTLWILK